MTFLAGAAEPGRGRDPELSTEECMCTQQTGEYLCLIKIATWIWIEAVLAELLRGEITPLSSSYNISGLVPVCWLLFQCFVLKPAKIPKS